MPISSDSPRRTGRRVFPGTVRARAADALGRIGVASDDAIEALSTAAVGDSSAVVAREAIQSLMQLDADADAILALMPKLMTDNRPSVVTTAMLALAEQGETAVPVLSKALQDEKSRYWALLIISDLGPVAKETVPSLAKLLNDADPVNGREILMALAGIGPDAADAVPQIADQLAHKDAGVRYAATFAVGSIGAKNNEAVSALNENVKSEDPILRTMSAWALAKLDPANPLVGLRAMRELATGLTSDDEDLQQAAAQCLSDLKPGPVHLPQLMPKIVEAFGSKDPRVRQSALDAIEGVLAEAGAGKILSGAGKTKPFVPWACVLAVGRLGRKAKEAAPALADALNDSRPPVRRDVALALAAIGPEAAAAGDALQKRLLEDDDADVRRAAAVALGRIGPQAKSSISALRTALTDHATQSIAAWALAHIAPGRVMNLA